MSGGGTVDQRVTRTRQRLAQALMGLGRSRDIDDIGVQELARAAGVGRSTFYAHFADRDHFLAHAFAAMITACEDADRREGPTGDLLPVARIVAHIAGHDLFARRSGRSRAMGVMLEAGEDRLRQIAENNLASAAPALRPEERRQAAAFVAGAFIGQLRLWMRNEFRTAPETLIAAHRRLAAGALAAIQTSSSLPPRPVHVP